MGGVGEGRVADERRDYAVLISLATREEAEVVAAALRAGGIDAFLGNVNHVNNDWGIAIALGGLQILVPRQRLSDAKAALRERIRDAGPVEDDERSPRRDKWKFWLMIAVYVTPVSISLIIWFGGIVLNVWDGKGWLGPSVQPPGQHSFIDPY
jgi:hypothetical protein